MQISGRGKIVVWQGGSLWVLAATRDIAGTDFHTHHAVQITIALEGRFAIRTQNHSANGPIAAVAADVRHSFEATGAVAFIFVEPECSAGRTIATRLFEHSNLAEIGTEPLEPILGILRERVKADGSPAEFAEVGRALVAVIAGELVPEEPNPRVQAMIDFIRTNLDGSLSLNAAAARAALSPSRARHVFAAVTGLPFKKFVLWQRLERAVELYATGQSLTESAYAAGFADSAHLSRTFRKTFGIPASMLEVG